MNQTQQKHPRLGCLQTRLAFGAPLLAGLAVAAEATPAASSSATDPLWMVGIKAFLVIFGLLTAFAYMTLIERRLLARIQIRQGPNRVGPTGLLQPLADAIKSIFKEDLVVARADKVVFVLAPMISVTFAVLTFGLIPFGPKDAFFGYDPWVIDLDVGLLYVFAVSEIAIYGIFLAGWASNSKYSLLGSLRSSASLISYELALGISLLAPVLLVGSLNLREIVEWQHQNGWLILYMLPAFAIFLLTSMAEAARTPFDLPEAEQELVGGYNTEYSSIKWALFQMAEYIHLITASALIPTIFLGGWRMPGFMEQIPLIGGLFALPYLWMFVKIALFLFFFIWVRGTLFRLRYDQLMVFSWGRLFPLALAWFLLSALVVAFKWPVAVLGWLSLLSLVVFSAYVILTAKPKPRAMPRMGAGD
ncbi:NADH dehydrogenase (quinone) [Meiothermus ruber DSM 1279]|jgi:NADH-quinone oxidoreductase subunit H|uniref:NADH-quinone oxidoreductase subunit H n=2 Tax=Meiothermus ruber TaxID=277 RepID=D3PT44_MEIRD|nr:NADH dehydrogenase (quinone) [Meiothermus ruber DSM 1279]AGK05928.1 NADH dehydrogenase (quinone) [Meiothermus ruber DSM 1279]MCL6530243.1 NADH-quinone oxidoreductase subunit NuoH [Meiothermus ruber]GAO75589.1 NADH dehydrogenase (quinone) [Meiothermus ruber H328]